MSLWMKKWVTLIWEGWTSQAWRTYARTKPSKRSLWIKQFTTHRHPPFDQIQQQAGSFDHHPQRYQEKNQGHQKERKENCPPKNHQFGSPISWIRSILSAYWILPPQHLCYSMKLISWNIRGTNNPRKHRMIKKKIQQYKQTILMLQETKSRSSNMDSLMSRL